VALLSTFDDIGRRKVPRKKKYLRGKAEEKAATKVSFWYCGQRPHRLRSLSASTVSTAPRTSRPQPEIALVLNEHREVPYLCEHSWLAEW